MTDDTDINNKLRAVFLAAIMVVSMAAIGGMLAGSGAAAAINADDALDDFEIGDIEEGEDTAVQTLNITDVDADGSNVSLEVDWSEVAAVGANVTGVNVDSHDASLEDYDEDDSTLVVEFDTVEDGDDIDFELEVDTTDAVAATGLEYEITNEAGDGDVSADAEFNLFDEIVDAEDFGDDDRFVGQTIGVNLSDSVDEDGESIEANQRLEVLEIERTGGVLSDIVGVNRVDTSTDVNLPYEPDAEARFTIGDDERVFINETGDINATFDDDDRAPEAEDERAFIQDLDVELEDDGEVSFEDSTEVEVVSDERGDDFNIQISAEFEGEPVGLDTDPVDFGDLVDILGPAAGGLAGTHETADGDDIAFDFDDQETGEYEFTFEVADADAETSFTLEHQEEVDVDINIPENVYEDPFGDVVEFTVEADDFDSDNELNVSLGQYEEDELNRTVIVTDEVEDGDVEFKFNTFLAQQNEDVSEFVEVDGAEIDDDRSVNNITVRGAIDGEGFVEDTYRIQADAGDERDRAQMRITERSTDSANTWVTPGAGEYESDVLDDLEADENEENLEAVLDLVGESVTEADEIAEGDFMITELEATGLEGLFAALDEPDDVGTVEDYTTAFATAANASIAQNALGDEFHTLEFEEQDTPRNVDATTFSLNDSDVGAEAVVAGDGAYYVVTNLENADGGLDWEDEPTFEANYSVLPDSDEDNRWGLVAYDDEEDEFAPESVYDEFSITEYEGEFDTEELEFDGDTIDEGISLEASDGQIVTGDTTAAPGTELEALVSGDLEVFAEESAVDSDRDFEFELDLSDNEDLQQSDEDQVLLELELDEPDAMDIEDAFIVLGDAEPANFDITDVTPGEDLTVEPGEELEIDVDVENTGEVEATQEVVFNFDGEELLTENLTLEGGESDSVTFEVDAPDEEGDYDWFVSTNDDESDTWTLTVEEDDEVDEPAEFEIVDVTPGEDLTAEPGEALTIDVDVENTGDEEATQEVEFVLDGDVLTGEELTLEGDEDGSVSLDVDAPGEEGTSDWFVQTEDDESMTWTLTVAEEDDDDEDDEADDEDDEADEEDDEDDDADDDGAGFGVIVAALALLGAALLAIRRQVQFE